MKKIYCYKNHEFFKQRVINVAALCEDGHVLAVHSCFDEYYMAGDLGIGTTSKHGLYDAHCGVGQWELEWVDDDETGTHPGFLAALAKCRAKCRQWREQEESK